MAERRVCLEAFGFFTVESAIVLLVALAEQRNNLGAHSLFQWLRSVLYECSTVT